MPESANPVKTVVFLGHTSSLGGAERSLLRLLDAMGDAINPIVVLAEPGLLADEIRCRGIDLRVLELAASVRRTSRFAVVQPSNRRVVDLLHVLVYVARLARAIREINPDVVHTNTLKAHLYGGLAGRAARTPVVWHLRDTLNESYLPASAVRAVRALARVLPDAVVGVSASVLANLALPDRIPASVVHDGLSPAELRTFHRSSPPLTSTGPAVLVMVGRLDRWKGQLIAIAAVRMLIEAGEDVELLIVGGPMFGQEAFAAEVEGSVADPVLNNRVQLLGHRDDVTELLAVADIAIHASVSPDPLPGVVLEAQAAGAVVIASAGGGVVDMVEDGRTGFLAPMGDPRALASVVQRVLHDKEHARAVAEAGRQQVVAQFTAAATAAGVLAVYDGVTA